MQATLTIHAALLHPRTGCVLRAPEPATQGSSLSPHSSLNLLELRSLGQSNKTIAWFEAVFRGRIEEHLSGYAPNRHDNNSSLSVEP